MSNSARPDLAVLLASLPMGGVGKMRVHLVNEIARRGYRVDLVLSAMDSPYVDLLSPAIRIVRIATSNAVTGVPGLAAYLLRSRPRVLLSQRIRVNVLALRARAMARAKTRMVMSVNTTLSGKLDNETPEKREIHLALLRRYGPRNDAIIAVSNGVAEDTARLIGWPIERIYVAPNPVVTPELPQLASAQVDHPWFSPGAWPVILGAGRLVPAKDFPTLICAFAKLRAQRPCRLMILGKGDLREDLERLAAELGVGSDVALPGFVSNPYAYMARAALFVLSSNREGSPNALTEALAVGTPLVATDCPSGPREILEGGRYGPLVPVGDVDRLASAMASTLDHPPDRATLQAAAQRYTVERSASAYIEALGLGAPVAAR
jgi:glycosyltransferase involved in cell wall biosynthesis